MRARDAGVLAACGSLAYASALGNPFAFDDEYAVQNNALLEDGAGLFHLLTRPGLTGGPVLPGHYRPLAMASLWLERHAFGVSPLPHRVVNLALHVLCAGLVGAFALRVLRRLAPHEPLERHERCARIAALLFCVHPLFSEAVEQVFKRTSSLATACMLGALLCFDAAFEAPGEPPRAPKRALLGATLGLSGLGLLAKESAAVMPALIALHASYAGLARGRARLVGGLAGAAALAPVALLSLLRPRGALAGGDHAGLRHLLAQPRAFAEYLSMLVMPARVPIAMGVEPAPWPPSAASVAGVLGLLALPLLAWRLRRRAPLASFAVIFGAVCVAPTSTLVPLNVVADPIHVYLAAVFVIVLVAVALSHTHEALAARVPDALARARPLIGALPAIALLLYAADGTLQVNERYAEPASAWRHAATLYPQGRLVAANACVTEPEPGRALAACRRAARLDPDNAFVVHRIVGLHAAAGSFDRAEQELSAARARPPRMSVWPLDLAEARLALRRDQLARAAAAFEAVLLHNPGQIEARVFLADLRLRLGRPGAAALVAGLAPPADAITRERLKSVLRALGQSPGGAPARPLNSAP